MLRLSNFSLASAILHPRYDWSVHKHMMGKSVNGKILIMLYTIKLYVGNICVLIRIIPIWMPWLFHLNVIRIISPTYAQGFTIQQVKSDGTDYFLIDYNSIQEIYEENMFAIDYTYIRKIWRYISTVCKLTLFHLFDSDFHFQFCCYHLLDLIPLRILHE